MSLKSLSDGLNNEFKESRFTNGQKCPYCGSNEVVKNGTRKNRQDTYVTNALKVLMI